MHGLHHAADYAPYQGPEEISGVLHTRAGNEVSIVSLFFLNSTVHFLPSPPPPPLPPPLLLSSSCQRLLKRLDFPPMKFTLYFMGYESAEDIPEDEAERTRWMFSRKATIELTQSVNTHTHTHTHTHTYHHYHNDYVATFTVAMHSFTSLLATGALKMTQTFSITVATQSQEGLVRFSYG